MLAALWGVTAIHEWGHVLGCMACGIRPRAVLIGRIAPRKGQGGWQFGWIPGAGRVILESTAADLGPYVLIGVSGVLLSALFGLLVLPFIVMLRGEQWLFVPAVAFSGGVLDLTPLRLPHGLASDGKQLLDRICEEIRERRAAILTRWVWTAIAWVSLSAWAVIALVTSFKFIFG